MMSMVRNAMVLALACSAQSVLAQGTTAFMRVKDGTNYHPIAQAATDASEGEYPDGWSVCQSAEIMTPFAFRDGNNIVNSFSAPTGTGIDVGDGVSGTYVGPPVMCLAPETSDESADWHTANQVLPAVSPGASTQLQTGLDVNALHQASYFLNFNVSNPEVDESILAGVSSDSATATGAFTEPLNVEDFDETVAPVQWAIVSLDENLTPVGTTKSVSGWLEVTGQAIFTGYEATGDAEAEVDITVTSGGDEIANIQITDGVAYYSYTSGGVLYFGNVSFTLTDNPSVSFDFDGTATVSSQADPVSAVEVAFKSWLHIADSNGAMHWGEGVMPRGAPGDPFYHGTGSAILSFEVMVDIVDP